MVSKKHSEWEKLHLNLMQAMMLIKEHVLIKSPFAVWKTMKPRTKSAVARD